MYTHVRIVLFRVSEPQDGGGKLKNDDGELTYCVDSGWWTATGGGQSELKGELRPTTLQIDGFHGRA